MDRKTIFMLIIAVVSMALLLALGFLDDAQAQDNDLRIYCKEGVVMVVPTGDEHVIFCDAWTPTPEPTHTPTSTVTEPPPLTPSPTPPATATETPTPSATATSAVIPTATPSPSPTSPSGQVLAFPGAEGFGRFAVGGRGGRVIEVTSLANSGTGTLRACTDASGPRTCVFRTGGTITLSSSLIVTQPYLTIAGQTAPGGGVTVKGRQTIIRTHNVIIRYLRFRRGPGSDGDNLWVHDGSHDVIIDHVSTSWSVDENMSATGNVQDVTLSWNIMAEGLYDSTADVPHSMGSLVANGAQRVTVSHNLYASNGKRNPRFSGATTAEGINNVVYNWDEHGYNLADEGGDGPSFAHLINNYLIAGPDTSLAKGVWIESSVKPGSKFWFSGNIGPGRPNSSLDNWLIAQNNAGTAIRSNVEVFTPSQTIVFSAEDAYTFVLAQAGATHYLDCQGAWVARRDSVDVRILATVANDTGHIIDDPAEVGGWPTLASGSACLDVEPDGMADRWEADTGAAVPGVNDGAILMADGYTRLEHFLNALD